MSIRKAPFISNCLRMKRRSLSGAKSRLSGPGRQWRGDIFDHRASSAPIERRGKSMPRTMSAKSNSPQGFSQARNTGPSETTTAISTMSSSPRTQTSIRCKAASPGMVHPDLCARRIINAADVDAADTTKSIPSSGVSDQIGRLVTAKSTPV